MKIEQELKNLKLHKRLVVNTQEYRIFITKVLGGLIYTYEFYGISEKSEHPHSSSVFIPERIKDD